MDTRLLFGWLLCSLVELTSGACNVQYVVEPGSEVEVTSPGYPSNFSGGAHCFYDLRTSFRSGDVIHVQVDDVTLSCSDDQNTLDVFDAFNTSPRYMGKICSGGQTAFVSPKERLYLVFKSGGQGSEVSRGFKFKVKAVPEFSNCYNQQAKIVWALPETQHLVSPYYPFEVAPNVHCRWLLKAPRGHKVTIEIVQAHMKGSNDCFNFGLYVFDGKTTYDDERLTEVCDKPLLSTVIDSSSNYLMVVFSSGPHVLHSGGGVKLAFWSSLADSDVVKKDYTLMFTLIGLLLGVASFTVVLVFIRFFILPARRRSLARRFTPNTNHRISITDSSTGIISMISLPMDPPPPYHPTESRHERQKKLGFLQKTCGCCSCFGHKKPPRHSQDSEISTRIPRSISGDSTANLPYNIAIPRDSLPNGNEETLRGVINLLQSGVALSDVSQDSQPREVTLRSTNANTSSNDYQELPGVSSCLRNSSGTRCPSNRGSSSIQADNLNDNFVNTSSAESRNTVRHYADSGYMDDDEDVGNENTDDEGAVEECVEEGEEDNDNDVENGSQNASHHPNNGAPSVAPGSDNLCDEDGDNDMDRESCTINIIITSNNMSKSNNNDVNDEDDQYDNDKRFDNVDEEGYEIPVRVSQYDNLVDDDEEEGVYHSLHFD